MAPTEDPENYSIAQDVAIIVLVMAVVAGLLGAVGYGAWTLFNRAEETFAELTREGAEADGGGDLRQELERQLERALSGKQERAQEAKARTTTIRFELYDALVDQSGAWTIYGDVINESPFAVGAPELDFAFRGASGEVVDTQSVRAELVALQSGESHPVSFEMTSRPGTTAFEIVGRRAQPADPKPRYDALAVSLERKRSRRGQSVLRGTVKNTGSGIAYDVTIDIVAYRDKAGNEPIGVAHARLDGPLAPNESRAFETLPVLLKRRALKLAPQTRAYAEPTRR